MSLGPHLAVAERCGYGEGQRLARSGRRSRTGSIVTGTARRQSIWESQPTRNDTSALCRIAKKRFFAEQFLVSDDYQTLLRIVVPRAARHTTCRRMPIDYVPASAFRPCLCRPISVRERCKSRKTVRRVRFYAFGARSCDRAPNA